MDDRKQNVTARIAARKRGSTRLRTATASAAAASIIAAGAVSLVLLSAVAVAIAVAWRPVRAHAAIASAHRLLTCRPDAFRLRRRGLARAGHQ